MDDIRLPLWVHHFNSQNDFMKIADTRPLTPIPAAVPCCSSTKQADRHINQTNISSTTSKTTDQPNVPMAISYSTVGNKSSHATFTPIIPTVTSTCTLQQERQRWKLELGLVRAELDHLLNTSNRKPNNLIDILAKHSTSQNPRSNDWSSVPNEGRLEILLACAQIVDSIFWRAWVADENGLRLLEAWLRGSVSAHKEAAVKLNKFIKDQDLLLIKLLKVLQKLPLTVENLTSYKFGNQINKIAEGSSEKFSTDVRLLAKELKNQWLQVAGLDKVAQNNHAGLSDAKRSNNHLSQQGPDVVKKAKLDHQPTDTTPFNTTIQKGPRALRPLTIPKKKPEALSLHSTNTILDPFTEAMQTIQKSKVVTDLDNLHFVSPAVHNPKHPKQNRKSVTFAPDDQLCAIKIVERLVYHQYDDDHEDHSDDDSHFVADLRQMDANEGRYLQNAEEFSQEEVDCLTTSEVVPQTVTNLEKSNRLSQSPKAQTKDPHGKRTDGFEKHEIEITKRSVELSADPSSNNLCRSSPPPKLMKLGSEPLADLEVQQAIIRAHPKLLVPIASVKPDVASGASPQHNIASDPLPHHNRASVPSSHHNIASASNPSSLAEVSEPPPAPDRTENDGSYGHHRGRSPQPSSASTSRKASPVAISKTSGRPDRRDVGKSDDRHQNGAPRVEKPTKAQVSNSNPEHNIDRRASASAIVSDRGRTFGSNRHDGERSQTNAISQSLTSRNRGAFEHLKELPRRSSLPGPMSSSRELRPAYDTTSKGSSARYDESRRENNRENDRSAANSSTREIESDRRAVNSSTQKTESDRRAADSSTRKTESNRRAANQPTRSTQSGRISGDQSTRGSENDRSEGRHSTRSAETSRRADYYAPRRSSDRYERPLPRPIPQAARSCTSQRHPLSKPVSSKGYNRYGDHIKCKWWPDCRLGSSCAYKHGH